MPRVNYCNTTKSAQDELTELLRTVCYAKCGNVTAAAEVVDFSVPTWRERVRHPEKLKLEELIRVAKRLNISKTKLMGIIERMM